MNWLIAPVNVLAAVREFDRLEDAIDFFISFGFECILYVKGLGERYKAMLINHPINGIRNYPR